MGGGVYVSQIFLSGVTAATHANPPPPSCIREKEGRIGAFHCDQVAPHEHVRHRFRELTTTTSILPMASDLEPQPRKPPQLRKLGAPTKSGGAMYCPFRRNRAKITYVRYAPSFTTDGKCDLTSLSRNEGNCDQYLLTGFQGLSRVLGVL